ncbi:MAG: hypothetical protein JSV18_04820, partial [Candidatus Bathyarchaeota archaeon]
MEFVLHQSEIEGNIKKVEEARERVYLPPSRSLWLPNTIKKMCEIRMRFGEIGDIYSSLL